MGKLKKTNAMRVLEKEGIEYESKSYSTRDGKNDGISVAEKVGESPKRVFKTLVLKGGSHQLYVCVIPSDEKLSLKKVSKITGEKNIDLLPVKKLRSKTGYVKGGCSPIAMKNDYPTFFHKSIDDEEDVILSAGHLGTQIKLSSKKVVEVVNGEVKDIIQ